MICTIHTGAFIIIIDCREVERTCPQYVSPLYLQRSIPPRVDQPGVSSEGVIPENLNLKINVEFF